MHYITDIKPSAVAGVARSAMMVDLHISVCIIVRPVGNYGLPEWLRISIGLPEENAAFIRALRDILKST